MPKKIAQLHDGDNTHIRAITDGNDVEVHTASGPADAVFDDSDWSPFAAFGDQDDGGPQAGDGGLGDADDDQDERDAFKALLMGLLMGDVGANELSEDEASALSGDD